MRRCCCVEVGEVQVRKPQATFTSRPRRLQIECRITCTFLRVSVWRGGEKKKTKCFFSFYSLKSLVRETNIPVIGCGCMDMVQVYLERVYGFVQGVTAVKSCLLLTLMSFVIFCCNESYPDTSHVQRMYSLMYVLFHLLHSPLVLCLLFKFSLSVSFSSIPFLILCLVFKLSLSVSPPQPSAYSPTTSPMGRKQITERQAQCGTGWPHGTPEVSARL